MTATGPPREIEVAHGRGHSNGQATIEEAREIDGVPGRGLSEPAREIDRMGGRATTEEARAIAPGPGCGPSEAPGENENHTGRATTDRGSASERRAGRGPSGMADEIDPSVGRATAGRASGIDSARGRGPSETPDEIDVVPGWATIEVAAEIESRSGRDSSDVAHEIEAGIGRATTRSDTVLEAPHGRGPSDVDDETEHRAGRATTDHGLAIEVPPGRGPSEVDGETEVGLGRAAAESGFEIEGMPGRGPSAAGGVSEDDRERATIERRAAIASDTGRGPLDRYADEVTARLSGLAATFEDVQLMRMRRRNRLQQELLGPDATDEEIRRVLDKHPELEPFVALERAQEKLLQKAMQNHALYPWLKQYRGLAGPRTARIIAAIGDPWRFPGQQCTGCTDDEGARVTHTFRPVFEVGVPCPVGAMDEWTRAEREDALEIYVGRTRTPRSKTGVRSIWHYFGLMPDETGRLVKLRKGKQASYNPAARVLVLGTNGPADQIVKQRTPKYRDIYDHYKETHPTNDEYPKWRIDSIAKTRASKAFIGDMLTEWKRRSPLDAETVVPSPSDANDE